MSRSHIMHSYIGLILCWIFYCVGVPAAVQVESLQCYAFLCRMSQDRWQTELLAEFPSLLVPLAGDNQV
jgi:U3 small nucleolar RNA-associated protein 10